MPTRCTEAATCSCNRNSWLPPGRTLAGKPETLDRTSGPPPALLRPSRSQKSPRPEYASEPSLRIVFRSGLSRIFRSQGDKPLVASQFTFARWDRRHPGKSRRLSSDHLEFLDGLVSRSPHPLLSCKARVRATCTNLTGSRPSTADSRTSITVFHSSRSCMLRGRASTCPTISASGPGRWYSCKASRQGCGRWPASLIPKMGRTGNEHHRRVSAT
jgi:hypothetical protein